MLSKGLFVHACDVMKAKEAHEEALCQALELCSPQEQVNAFIYSDYRILTIQLLKEAFGLPEDDDFLEYWAWDCGMGDDLPKNGYVVDGVAIDLSTPDKTYDYIIERLKNKEE